MAGFTYNVGAEAIAKGNIDFLADTMEFVLVKDTYAPNRDDTNTILAAAEASGITGYVGGYGGAGRKVLGTKAITNDTANDRTKYDCADPSSWTLGVGDTLGGVIVQKKGGANDTTAILLFFLTSADFPFVTNGGTFTAAIAATGLGYTQQ